MRTCDDFPHSIVCCDSCHEDDAMGYPMLGFGDATYVCCAVWRWADEHGVNLSEHQSEGTEQ